jgi:sterol desaturase/sphingolipid hydroxylase (fatty acid hydroxylase superfamily)
MTFFVTYCFYPVVLIATFWIAWLKSTGPVDLQWLFTLFAAARFLAFLLAEWRYPARPQWSMSWRSFTRDLKYMAAGAIVVQAGKLIAGWWSIGAAAAATGMLAQLPIALQLLVAVLAYELVQYWLHRISHEARGPLGRFLWRVHVVHHLPPGVYYMMHPVMHPLNLAMAIALGLIPAYVLGLDARAGFLFNVLVGLQASFSHFNAPGRAGPLNYLLTGTELHRLHHSEKLEEAGNFGVVTPVLDMVFGTYIPARTGLPERLGVTEADAYPQSHEFWSCMRLPFRSD